MKTGRVNMKKILCCVNILFFLLASVPVTLQSAEQSASIRLRNLRSYTVTEKQLELLKDQQGISFYAELPEVLPKGQLAIAVPEQLGGGYLAGTAEDIASAFNSSGITVGLTASAVSGFTSSLASGTAAAIMGIVLAVATGSSKPLVSQAYSKAQTQVKTAEVKEAEEEGKEGKKKDTKWWFWHPDDWDGSIEHGWGHFMANHHPGFPYDH